MNFKKIAENLIAAKTESERQSLLKAVPQIDFSRLAFAVKEICYSFWTSEPIRARNSAAALQSLYKFSPQKEIEAYHEWISGIAEITRGNLMSAIKRLDDAAAVFVHLGQEHEAAQTQVAKLYALALLGHFDKAIETGNNALKIFVEHGDELAAGKIEKNIGNIFSRAELHSQAEKFYAAAHRRFVKLRNFEELAMVENGLAITYSALNDFKKAEKIYHQALERARQLGNFLTQAEIEASIGNLALFRGKLDEALKFLELSRRKYEILEMPHQTAIAELEIADIYLELNLIGEAFAIYEKLADQLHKLKMPGEEARARANFGRVAAISHKTKTARKQLKKAVRLYLSEKNQVGSALVKLNEAKLELDLKNYRKVLSLTNAAEIFLNQSENSRHRLPVRWLQAEARRNLGETAAARELFTRIFTDSIKREQPNTAQAAQISLGKIATQERNYKTAKKHFRRAIRLIEKARAPLAAEEFRMAFLADKLAPFENLAKIYLAENKLKQAFQTIEKARSRSLAESLGQTAQAINEDGQKTSGKLADELTVLREELNWFYSRLQRADETEIENFQAEAQKREKKIAALLRQIASTEKVRFGKRNVVDFGRLQNQIGKEKVLLEFVSFEGNLSAFVITDKKISFVADIAKESEIIALLESLRFQLGTLRYGAKTLESLMPELVKRALFYLQKLDDKLLAPLKVYLENRHLIIVPVGALHYVPFQALHDGTSYQIEVREIVYTPSATIWQLLASKPQQKLSNALLIGYADELIPLVGREIENLKRIFPESKSLTGDQATFAAFMENAPQFDILHMACHGQFRPENPLFSSLHLADGFITVRDICQQKLKASIVTLSACETGVHKIFAGDEILGLARGFLAAGAKSLILSLWKVNDEATSNLMKDFYTQLQTGQTVSAALRIAQRGFIKRGIHPYFWSPFVLIGK